MWVVWVADVRVAIGLDVLPCPPTISGASSFALGVPEVPLDYAALQEPPCRLPDLRGHTLAASPKL
jgi:hypothetical protein